MSEPRVKQIKQGWMALGDGWAVEGTTEREAREHFREAERRHQEIDAKRGQALAALREPAQSQH